MNRKDLPGHLLAVVLLAIPALVQAQTVLDGYFVESGGLLVIEAESIGAFPDSWRNAATHTAPNIEDGAEASGGNFLTWEGNQFFGTPGTSELVFPIQINTPGTYRFRWRSQTGLGTNTTEHNDTWVRIDGDAFFGRKRNSGSIVCPKGYDPAENDCSGGVPNGGGGAGWFKVYTSGANSWRWTANTSDNDAHQIFVRFDAAGIYDLRLSARSSFHIVDRLVLSIEGYSGNPESLALPESEFVPGSTPPPPPPDPQPPVAVDDSYAMTTGTTLTVSANNGVLANDSDPNDDDLTSILASAPATGSLNLSSDGSFSYTPPPAFEGVATFRYRASDGALQSTQATVTIQVSSSEIDLSLIDAQNDQAVQPLVDGTRLVIPLLGFSSWTVAATGTPPGTNSVTFELTGPLTQNQTESVAPFALFGDQGGDYSGRDLVAGEYALTVRAHSGTGGGGTVLATRSIEFFMTNDMIDDAPMMFRDSFEAR